MTLTVDELADVRVDALTIDRARDDAALAEAAHLAAILSVATPPKHRRRGYGGAISAHAARIGFDQGADLAWLQTSDLDETVYRPLGFRHSVMHSLLTRPP